MSTEAISEFIRTILLPLSLGFFVGVVILVLAGPFILRFMMYWLNKFGPK